MKLDRRLRQYVTPKVLVIDAMGYLTLDDRGVTLFFPLLTAPY